MACSTPVVATATGGSAEFLIDGANCLQVGIDDERGLANAVRRLAGDPALRERLVHGGHVTATELSLPRWIALLEDWHIAAATRFAEGRPPHRGPITDVLLDALAEW
jgi:glycosyltransferase involved in cell wall biosynthesis